jgi:hypothetical protein
MNQLRVGKEIMFKRSNGAQTKATILDIQNGKIRITYYVGLKQQGF